MKNKRFSREITVFHGRLAPEKGTIVGYGAIIEALNLPVPLPSRLSLIGRKQRRFSNESWNIFTPRHEPDDTLYKQLVFALKYEGINLLVFKKLFEAIPENEVIKLLQIEPLGQYTRRIWFLYEWMLGKKLDLANLDKGNYVTLIDEKLQYTCTGSRSPRHRIVNNLPGTRDFCPLIYRTEKIEAFRAKKFSEQENKYLKTIHKNILQRAAAFLLLKDSRASFNIEGENPKSTRTARWGQAIGQAGIKPLSLEELIRLQQIVISSKRFINMGLRKQGGFVGEHDRITGEPIPDHISARWQDLEQLITGLIETNRQLEEDITFDAVLGAAMIAFGFVFIHPFEDGNGRIHRYLIHHMLARKQFAQQGVIFPVSASILDHIDEYRKILEYYSLPLLDYIKWKPTPDNNVEVLNETIDYYRYFDVTRQAEFLYECVEDTITNVIPGEIKYLQHYDEFKRFIDDQYEMPDKTVAILVRFLEQNRGKLSKRARSKEFKDLNEQEVLDIEIRFSEIFSNE